MRKALVFSVLLLSRILLAEATDNAVLKQLLLEQNYGATVELSHRLLSTVPTNGTAKIYGALSLLERDYPYSAAYYVSRLNADDWKQAPELGPTLAQVLAKLPYGALTRVQQISPAQLQALPSPVRENVAIHLALEAIRLKQNTVAAVYLREIPKGSQHEALAAALIAGLSPKGPATFPALELSGPEDTQAFLLTTQARLAYQRKEYVRAATLYAQAAGLASEPAPQWRELTWTHISARNFQEAKGAARRLRSRSKHPYAFEGRLLLALSLAELGDTEEAREELTELSAAMGEETLVELRDAQAEKYIDGLEKERNRLRGLSLEAGTATRYLQDQMDAQRKSAENALEQKRRTYPALRKKELNRLLGQAALVSADVHLREKEKLGAQAMPAQLIPILQAAVNDMAVAFGAATDPVPSIQFRQAELLWELAGLQLKAFEAASDLRLRDEALQNKQKAIALAEAALGSPAFAKRAQALFFIGFAKITTGQTLPGRTSLVRFTADFPKHEMTPTAWQLLGDSHFDEGKYAQAASFFQKIVATKESPLVGYALYKLGWCAYHQNQFATAIQYLEQSISWTDQWQKSAFIQNIEREARRDLISIFAEVGDPKKAPEYFARLVKENVSGWLLDLGKELERSGQYEKAAELFRRLLALDPENSNALGFKTSLLRSLGKIHEWNAVTEAMQTLASGAITPSADPMAQTAEREARELALAHHKEYLTSREPGILARQNALDQAYLKIFSAWPESHWVQLELAKMKQRQGEVEAAATLFRDRWSRFQARLEGGTREEALRLLIQSLEKLEEREKPGRGMSALALEIIGLSETYSQNFTQFRYIRSFQSLGASLYFKYDDLARGMPAAQRVFDFNPRDEFGKKAFENLRVAYYKAKDWEATFRWSTEMATRKFPGMEAYTATLQKIQGESLLLWGENTEEDVAAGKIYAQATKYPALKPFWEKALYNAFVRFQKGNQPVDALKVAKTLETTFPQSEKLLDIAPVRASLLRDAGDYEEAYPILLGLLNRTQKFSAKEQDTIRLQTALLAEAVGEKGTAQELFSEMRARDPLAQEVVARALDRLARDTRQPASREIQALNAEAARFEEAPLPEARSLMQRLQQGGTRLEALVKSHLNVFESGKYPESVALEAYCQIPFLYSAYEQALSRTANALPETQGEQLLRIATPLAGKAREFGQNCLSKSIEAEHGGKNYRRANQKWGWEWDPIKSQRVQELVTRLGQTYPTLDLVVPGTAQNEGYLIEQHLNKQGNAESWFSLARVRCLDGRTALCRLTLEEALQKYPFAGKMVNGLGVIEWKNGVRLAQLFDRAAKQGSPAATVNLALYHLKDARLNEGWVALNRAVGAGYFDGSEEFKEYLLNWGKK